MFSERRSRSTRFANRRGAMLAFVAVSMVGMLGMLALALDIGAGNRQRRIAQTAADAGSIGGATQIYRNNDSVSVWNAAMQSALLNGFPGGEVTVNYPPASGPYAGNTKYVEVLIAKSIPTLFGSLLNKPTLDVYARAVAGVDALSMYCVYGLSNTGFAIDVPGELDASGCAVASNSGIRAGKICAESLDLVGGIDDKDIWCQGNAPEPTPTTGIPPFPDPFDDLEVPAETSCDFTNYVVTAPGTLNPGVYCGGIDLGTNIVTNLNPGTYIIRGGGIDGSKNGSELRGTEVTIINANGPGNDVSAYRPIVFGNTCYVGLTAPTSGPFKGIVIFADPDGPSTGTYSVNELCGKGEKTPLPDIVGTIYMPTQTFKLANSNGKLIIAGALIANVISGENGGGMYTIVSDASGNSGPKRISLVQ